MYGQGNFNPRYGHAPHTPMPPFQQRPNPMASPMPAQFLFQQGPPAPPPPVINHASQAVSSVVHHGPPAYTHAPPAPPSTVRQGQPPQGLHNGLINTCRPHIHPIQPVHGRAVSWPTQLNTQFSSHSGSQNVQHIDSPALAHPVSPGTGHTHPGMLRAPPPPRVLPPPPSYGPTLYRMPDLPSAATVAPGVQHTPITVPPPPTSSFLSSALFGSFVHPHVDSPPRPPLPPPPSSPPPLPPPPPPSTSPPAPASPQTRTSMSIPSVSDHSDLGPSSHKSVVSEVMASKSVNDGHLNREVGTGYEGGSQVQDGLSAGVNMDWDVALPPPRPADEKIVQKIEVLCEFIAKNGPDFEEMACQKESGNLEFEFLSGGEPGSEAAVAHEYFLWMKRKYNLQCNYSSANEKIHSLSRPLHSEVSTRAGRMMDAASNYPSDSDMDMEDDITKSDKSQDISNLLEDQSHESALVYNSLDVKEQVHAQQSSAECSAAKDLSRAKLLWSGSAGLAECEKGSANFPDHLKLTAGGSFFSAHGVVENLVPNAEFPLSNKVEKYNDSSPSATVAAASGFNSESFTGKFVKGCSPFRLLEDYASDNSSENDDGPSIEAAVPRTASPSMSNRPASSQRDSVSSLDTNNGSKHPCASEKGFPLLSDPLMKNSHSNSLEALEFSAVSQRDVEDSVTLSTEIRKTDEDVDDDPENDKPVDHDVSDKTYQGKKASRDGGLDVAQSDKSLEDIKSTSSFLKVDEFGRLLKDCASDSDSDDPRYSWTHSKRERSWSRSRSPLDRRKKRRSLWRRKDKRSQSRSWSPRKRSSRSSSPVIRRGGDRIRWDRVQNRSCFHFLRGRCYHGASCRYLHHNSYRGDKSRPYARKDEYLEVPFSSKNSGGTKNFREEILFHDHEKIRSQESRSPREMPCSSKVFPKDKNIVDKREDLFDLDQNDQLIGINMEKFKGPKHAAPKLQEAEEFQDELDECTTHLPHDESLWRSVVIHHDGSPFQPPTSIDTARSPGDNTKPVLHSVNELQQKEPDLSVHADHRSQQMDVSTLSDSSPDQTSRVVPNESPTIGSIPDKLSLSQSYSGNGSMNQPSAPKTSASQVLSQSIPSVHFSYHCSQPLPPPPPPEFSQVRNAPYGLQSPHGSQPVGDHNKIPPTVNLPFRSVPGIKSAPCPAPLPNQQPSLALPKSSWTFQPLPPPPHPPPSQPPYANKVTVNGATANPVGPFEFQHNHLPVRNDFDPQTSARLYSTELPTHSQFAAAAHLMYHRVQEPRQLPLQVEDLNARHLPVGHPMTVPYGGSSQSREDQFKQVPVQGFTPSSSSAENSLPLQPMRFLGESPGKMQSFPSEAVSLGEHFESATKHHSYVPAEDDVSNHVAMMPIYPSDLERNQLMHLSDIGGSRFSAHHNPYASTFELPLNSRFSYSALRREKDTPCSNKYDTPFSLSRVHVDGRSAGNIVSRQMASSPNSALVQRMPRLGGDQYDPIFDSIEPPSSSLTKFDHIQKQESTNCSNIMFRPSGSNKPLDLEENKQPENVGAVAGTTSLENDEYGETADAEVGAVVNGSLSSPIDLENTAAGEIEIDQIKSPGKSKKSKKNKDSKSIKLFRVALANFVKEVLKPSWRQGNMSKEAFKTIVKKTVDKVSGAMKGHQIPKSQAKVNQYIDSSQRKLTKLVMGYVDKYVKM